MSQHVNWESQASRGTPMGLARPVTSNSLMKGIESLSWHIKKTEKKILPQWGCSPNLLNGGACAPSDLGLTSLRLRVDRNGLQMNEIRSMCSEWGTASFDRRIETELYISLQISILKKKETKTSSPLIPLNNKQINKQTEPNKTQRIFLWVDLGS